MFASLEKAKERLAICKECEHFKSSIKTCKKCNCFMPFKTTLNLVSCPVGKWETVEQDLSITEKYIIEE